MPLRHATAAIVVALALAAGIFNSPSLPIAAARAPAALPGAFSGPDLRDGDLSIHMAPAENLEAIDVAALDGARREIDIAAYVLTDYPVIWALGRAADRGIVVRILLDRSQHEARPEVPPLTALRARPGVDLRIKRGRVLMHLKAYEIDGRLLRLGSANFSASGLKRQDNELTIHESRTAATRFRAIFTRMFEAGERE